MLAVKIYKYGPIADLVLTETPRPEIGPGDVLVEIEASSINPSDILSAEGRFPHGRLPRILGRDFAGRIVEGPNEMLGKLVWGSGGDLGITRDGTHAEFVAIPIDAVSIRPQNLTAEQGAAVGVPFQTAWTALVDRGKLTADQWVVISGATGAVGSACIQIASAIGAKVIALVRNESDHVRVYRSKVAATVSIESGQLVNVVRDLSGGRGVSLAVNAVGASVFEMLYETLADFGHMAVFSVLTGREVSLDLLPFYRRNLTLHGVNTVGRDVVHGAKIADRLTPLFESGLLAAPVIDNTFPLSRARDAYLAAGSGKTVLVPDLQFAR